ncbi:MAG TPA: glycosyltransferase WbuB, partial [Candidatus Moranbacteria bacterium]|nr:glycosyltransferase WbuB [Candidatus Moranbacteria bacterium]
EKVIQDGDKVRVIHNWVNTEELSPGIKNNEFSSLYKIDSKFVVSFAGILGHLQDFEVILQAAKNLEKYNDIEFIIVGDGVAKGSIEENIRKKNIRNVRLIPMQPKDKYPQVLHSSDVGLVTLVKDLKTPVIPSKILSIMSSAKPVLATMLLSGDAPKIIKESKGGFFYDAGDAKGLTEGILSFYNNTDKIAEYGLRGRKYILRNFSLEISCKNYRELFEEMS